MRRLENRIPMTAQVAITLIVSHHDDDVGFATGGCELRLETDKCQKK